MKRQNIEFKFIKVIGAFFFIILMSAFVLTLIGAIDLRYLNDKRLPDLWNNLACFGMFMLNMFILFSISLRIFNKHIIYVLLLFIPVYFSMGFIPQHLTVKYGTIITMIVPFLYVSIISKISKIVGEKKNYSSVLISYGGYYLIIFPFQELFAFIKENGFRLDYIVGNAVTDFIYRSDYWLVGILLYLGVKEYEKVCNSSRVDSVNSNNSVCGDVVVVSKLRRSIPEKQSVSENGEQHAQTIKDELDTSFLTPKELFIFRWKQRGYFLSQLIGIFLIGMIHNKFIEVGIMLIVVYFVGNIVLRKLWHSNTLFWCSVVTYTGFYILIRLTLPITISLLFSTSLSALFTYLMHRAGVHAENYEQLMEEKNKREALNNKSRRKRAEIALQSLSPAHIDYGMLQDYVNGETLEILADKYNMSSSTLNRKINALTRM